MSEQVDSGLESQETPKTTADSALAGDQQKPNQANLPDYAEVVRAGMQDPQVREELRRMFQSEADQRASRLEKTTTKEVEDRLSKFAAALGIDAAQASKARRQVLLEEMAEAYESGEFAPREVKSVGGNVTLTGEAAKREASSVLGELGIDSSSEVGKSLLSTVDNKIYASQNDLRTDLMRTMSRQLAKPSASAATTVVSGGGSEAPEETDASALTKDYQAAIAAARQLNRGRLSGQQLAEIKADFRKKGLDVF